MLPRKYTIKICFIFPPHLTSVSAPGETGNPEIESFRLHAACFFYQKHETRWNITYSYSWITLRCQNDRLGTPERT